MNYGDVCEAKTRGEMRRRFGILLSQVRKKFGKVDEAMQRTNVGYVAGYYDEATRIRVLEWLGAEHPIFGSSFPTPKEAFDMGKALGAKQKPESPAQEQQGDADAAAMVKRLREVAGGADTAFGEDSKLMYDAAVMIEKLGQLEALYYELLYAVGNKYPGETRHQTALRYIRRAEAPSEVASQAVNVPPPPERP